MIAYIINLDRSPERWAYMTAMCAEQGLQVRRVPAIDGRTYGQGDLDVLAPPVPGRRRLSASEVACFESHRLAWSMVAESDEDVALVLEDDVILTSGAGRLLPLVAQAYPPADLIKLNNSRRPILLRRRPSSTVEHVRVHLVQQRTADASAYLVRRAAAERLLATTRPMREELDLMLFDPANGLTVAQTRPALSAQEKYCGFRFLPDAASHSLLQPTRAEETARKKAGEGPRGPLTRLEKEAQRFFRRRALPYVRVWAGLLLPSDQRLAYRSIPFDRH